RLDRRLDNEIRCPEIWLADAEIDDVPALGHERVGTGKDRKGVLLTDAVKGRDCTKHDGRPPGAAPLLRHARGAPCWRGTSPDQTAKIKREQSLRRNRRGPSVGISAEPAADIAHDLEA